MPTLPRSIRNFTQDEEGAALAEYGLLIALIAAVCIIAITTLGTKISSVFEAVATKFD